ncbi:MAG: LPS biosynthesis protein [Arcobacter sp.]|nr:MAG: LPS biosynthesis protein [Arcobacter sp.]
MRFCKRCFYPESHPLNIIIDEEGICSGCRVHEEKFSINWKEKEDKLKKLLHQYKSTSGLTYDCIIPVSGAKDSYYIVDLIKNVYGMNPLLVNYNKHYNTSIGHRNFAYLKTRLNCDAMSMVVQPQKVKKITQHTLDKFGSIYWHVLAGETVFPVQVAVRFKIPLIIWGAHQGLDQVGMFSHDDEVEMTRKYRKEHDLMGFEAEDLLKNSDLDESDILQYIYPHDKEIEKTGVRGIYLGNYIPWDSKKFHEKMIQKFDFESAPQQRTFDIYNHTDCVHYSGLHDYIKTLKHGYGKVTDHASRELRWGRLNRKEGFELIKSYQNIKPSDTTDFCKWIDISEHKLFETLEKFRNPLFWKRDKGEWELKHSILSADNNLQKFPTQNKDTTCNFILTDSKVSPEKEYTYKLIEKGFVIND